MQEERAPPGKPGTPQKPAASKASEVRGNSNGDRRHSRRDEEDGQPSESDAGSASGSGDGATWNRNQGSAGRSRMRPTRNLIDRQRWSMHDPMSDRITVRRRQRPQGFWRFRFWEDCRGKMAKFLNRARQQLIDTEWPKIHSRRQTDFRLHVFEILAERFACMCQLEIRIVKNMDYAYNLKAT
jgi:hypothetical protein